MPPAPRGGGRAGRWPRRRGARRWPAGCSGTASREREDVHVAEEVEAAPLAQPRRRRIVLVAPRRELVHEAGKCRSVRRQPASVHHRVGEGTTAEEFGRPHDLVEVRAQQALVRVAHRQYPQRLLRRRRPRARARDYAVDVDVEQPVRFVTVDVGEGRRPTAQNDLHQLGPARRAALGRDAQPQQDARRHAVQLVVFAFPREALWSELERHATVWRAALVPLDAVRAAVALAAVGAAPRRRGLPATLAALGSACGT